MNDRKKLTRREALRVMGSAPLLPMLDRPSASRAVERHGRSHSVVSPGKDRPPWTPKFFNAHQNETVTVVAELIIPKTGTPGARAAKVNEFIDLVLSEETSKIQQKFVRGLDWIDRKSGELFGGRFTDLKPENQTAILTAISSDTTTNPEDQIGVSFFKDIKARTIFAYYTSEVGIHRELEYKGLDYLTEFPGCQHPEHLNWEPKA